MQGNCKVCCRAKRVWINQAQGSFFFPRLENNFHGTSFRYQEVWIYLISCAKLRYIVFHVEQVNILCLNIKMEVGHQIIYKITKLYSTYISQVDLDLGFQKMVNPYHALKLCLLNSVVKSFSKSRSQYWFKLHSPEFLH